MSKRQAKTPQNGKATKIDYVNNLNVEIDYDRLAEAIVKAKKMEQELHRAETLEKKKGFHDKMGYKTEGNSLSLAINHLACAIKLIIWPKKYNSPDELRGTRTIMISFMTILFGGLEVLFYILASFFVFSIFFLKYVNPLIYALNTFLMFILARIFRIVRQEVDKISDRDQTFVLFSSIVSFVALIVAIVTAITAT